MRFFYFLCLSCRPGRHDDDFLCELPCAARPPVCAAHALRRCAPCRISLSRPFFCLDSKAKKMKPEKASLHAPQVRFMAQRAASYFALCAKCFIKPPFQMKHCFRLHFITPRQAAIAPQYETSPLRSDMKHKRLAPLV